MSPANLSFVLPVCLAAAALSPLPVLAGGAHKPPIRGEAVAASEPAARAEAGAEIKSDVKIEASAAGAAASAATATADPLETLRLRLAERLSKGRTAAGAGPNELRVVTRAAAAAPAGEKPRGGTSRSAVAAHGHGATKARAGDGHAAWAYDGSAGPQAWATLRPEFAACGKGSRQSPIDIRGGLSVDLEPVRFDYRDSRFAVVDNGHTVQVDVAAGNTIEVGGRRYELQQFHFHRPAEERIDGRSFEMSLHLVHKDAQGRVAIVALLIDRGLQHQPPQPVVQQVWNHLPLERHQPNVVPAGVDIQALLPDDRRYYTYMGSLTTPPCSEGVQWIVMRSPVTMPPEQIEIFSRLYPMNARPIQSAAGRRIMQSN